MCINSSYTNALRRLLLPMCDSAHLTCPHRYTKLACTAAKPGDRLRRTTTGISARGMLPT